MTSKLAWWSRAACAFAVSAIAACESSPSEPEVVIDFSEFDAAMESFVVDNALEGATVAIVHRDYGLVHLRAFGAFDVDRIILLASSSKVLSSGVLMRLADQGLVDVDAPVSDVMSAFGVHKTDVSVAQLLSNSSGFVGLIDDPLYGPYICQYLNVGSITDCAATIYSADDEADRVPPDTAFRYGGGQWQLAGGIAEIVSGKSWDELVAETYSEPCGLESLGYANYFSDAIVPGGGSLGDLIYPDFFDGDVTALKDTDNPNLEGGAYSNARDYGAILLMHLRGGVCGKRRVLSEAAVARMREDRIASWGGSTGDSSLPGYGFGWWVSRDRPGLIADPGAFGTSPWLDLDRGYGAVILLEQDANVGPSARRAMQPILERIFDAIPRE